MKVGLYVYVGVHDDSRERQSQKGTGRADSKSARPSSLPMALIEVRNRAHRARWSSLTALAGDRERPSRSQRSVPRSRVWLSSPSVAQSASSARRTTPWATSRSSSPPRPAQTRARSSSRSGPPLPFSHAVQSETLISLAQVHDLQGPHQAVRLRDTRRDEPRDVLVRVGNAYTKGVYHNIMLQAGSGRRQRVTRRRRRRSRCRSARRRTRRWRRSAAACPRRTSARRPSAPGARSRPACAARRAGT